MINRLGLILLLLLVLTATGCKKCVYGHYEMVYHPLWIQYMWMGKVMMPIVHPAHKTREFVCDQYDK